jgi:hypothetical protein
MTKLTKISNPRPPLPNPLPFANDKELGRKKTNEQSSPKEEAYGRKELIFHHDFFQIV